jgi:clan AA aspartic protease (TIGR02281 family)
MPVGQLRLGDGSQVCGFGEDAGTTHFVLSQQDDGAIFIGFIQDDTKWTSGGAVSFEVDGRQYNFQAFVSPGTDTGLMAKIDNEGVGLDFLHDLYNGSMLNVTAGNAHGTFSLTGSATAITVLHRCADAIMAEKNGYTAAGTPPPPPPRQATSPVISYQQPWRPETTEVPLMRDRYGTFTLLATLNGTTILPFTLDTAASNVTIPENIATELMRNGSLTRADYVGDAVSTLADGSKRHDTLYTLRSITVGGRTVTNVECSVGDEGSSLLLGQSFLRKSASWSIDNVRGVLLLK